MKILACYLWSLWILWGVIPAFAQVSEQNLAKTSGPQKSSACHLVIGIWHKGPPYISADQDQPVGLYPDIFSYLLNGFSCTYSFYTGPAARMFQKASVGDVHLSLFTSPRGETRFSGNYIRGNFRKRVEMGDVLLGKEVLFYARSGYIGLKHRSLQLEQPGYYKKYRIGTLKPSHIRDEYWRDYMGLPYVPDAFSSTLQGLKALAAERLDLFLFYASAIDQLQGGYDLFELKKETILFEFRLLVYSHGLKERAHPLLNHLEHRASQLLKSPQLKDIVRRHSREEYFYFPE